MIEITGNMWQPNTYEHIDGTPANITPDAICITTNGFIKRNNEAVMGRGCAKQAADMFPRLKKSFGTKMRKEGNFPHVIYKTDTYDLISFPVKPEAAMYGNGAHVIKRYKGKFKRKDIVPGWMCTAETDIIERSCKLLNTLVDFQEYKVIVLPRPGCGAGELKWTNVKPILEKHLDNRFYCVTYRKKD